MTTIRSFIAIDLSAEARQAISALQSRLKAASPPHSVRWTAVQNIHLTLHFLGDIEPADVAPVTDALRAATRQFAPFDLQVGGLGCFPNVKRPRIVWVGLTTASEPLLAVQQLLGQALHKTTGFEPETRPYTPHLTIGRVKNGAPARHLRQLSEVLAAEQKQVGQLAALHVTDICLIKSELKPAGSVYTQLGCGQLTA